MLVAQWKRSLVGCGTLRDPSAKAIYMQSVLQQWRGKESVIASMTHRAANFLLPVTASETQNSFMRCYLREQKE